MVLLYLVGNVINIKHIMRKRFKTSRLCSSENYVISKKLHKAFLIEEHNKNALVLEHIIEKHSTKKAFVRCFGELLPITLDEAEKIGTSVTIIWL